ncbi:hypothetical protein FOZ63_023157, partial [Perkinsus olseni]
MIVEGPELPAPAMLFETRSLEAPLLTPSEVPNGPPPSPPRAVDPPYAPALEPPRALPVEPPRTTPVEPPRVPVVEHPGPLVAEPLPVSDVQQPSVPNLGEKLSPVIPAVSPTAPVTPRSGGEVKGECSARSPSLRDANTQYDVCITEAAEPELIPVKGAASTGAASPSAGFEISTQAGRQPDPPSARDMSPADKASAVVAGLITASTAEQEDLAALDWQLEENDHLTNDEITMAIVGWRPLEGARRPGSKKVYFSAKLYTFPPQTTDAAELPYTACHSALSSSRTGQRVAGRDGHDIELEMHCSETGMLVATASVPLRGIPRQQRMVSRSEREVPCCGLAHTQGAPNVLGWLQVVIENCGSRECGQLGHSHPDLVPSPAGGYAQCREGGRQHRAAPGRKNTRVKARRLPWPGTAPNATHDAVKYFADQREKSRLQLVQRRMRETLLERRYLPAVAGEASYFTVPFTSPLPVEALYSVQLGRVGTQGGVAVEGTGRCGLSLVTDPAEWRYLVTSQGFTEPDCGYELFIATSEFLLRPGQTVELPFRFLSFLESAEDLVYDISIRRSGGDTVRVVELVVPGPLGFLVNQVARYWEPERAALRKTLLLKGEIETEPVLVISPEDSGVSVTTQDQPGQLFISLVAPRFTEGPREAVCVVYARGDNYREQPLWVVRIVCYGLLGEYVKGVVGQHFEKIIQLPPQLHQGAPTMVAYSSNPSLAGIELSCVPVPEYGPCHIPLSILPSASGMSSCLVFAAVAGSVSGVGRPGAAWILNIQAEPPTVTETHELALAYGQQCRKRLPFRNPLTRQTEFTVRSSDPEILQVASTSLKLAPLTASHVDLVFRPVQGHMRRKSECFLFISTSDGQVSDTRLFKLSYTPDWPGPPEPKRAPVLTATIDDPMEDRSEPSATRGRSISRPRTADQQPRSAVQLELVLDNSSVVSVSSTRVEDLVRTALTSAARLPPSMLHVSKWVADYLFVGMGSLLRDRAADFTFRQIERSSSQRVTPFIWAAASRSDGYPGEHVVTLVAKRCGVFEAPDVARILRTSVEDSSSLLKRKGGLLASLFEGARVEIGDRSSFEVANTFATLVRERRTSEHVRDQNKKSATTSEQTLADDFAAELEAWGKSSMAHLLESRTALRQPPVRGSVNVKHSSSGSMQTK